jgi:adenylosuccinate synthase
VGNVVIIGAQWGDEGKGKVVDLYTEFADVVVRFGGGANAGHTLVVDGQKLVTHLVPSGVLRAGKRCVLGSGMVIDPAVLLDEITALKARDLLANDADLMISDRAHVIFPFHREIDALRERGQSAIGTTKRGIGPAYEATTARRGIRTGDLGRPARLRELIARNLDELNPYLERLGGQAAALEPLYEQALGWGQALARYLGDTSVYLYRQHRQGRDILFEGAQGTLLDVDHGTYPYVTSASTVAAGACTGTGLGPKVIDTVIGICKAYSTRVGSGPFPTELKGPLEERLRKAGDEFGATTGRPRRVGWLDVAALRYAVRVNGIDGLALTKLDVLRGVHPIRLCVGYRVNGVVTDEIPLDPDDIQAAVPIYEDAEGFDADIQHTRELDDLPASARRFIRRIEALVETSVDLISVGPGRAETMMLRNPFRR